MTSEQLKQINEISDTRDYLKFLGDTLEKAISAKNDPDYRVRVLITTISSMRDKMTNKRKGPLFDSLSEAIAGILNYLDVYISDKRQIVNEDFNTIVISKTLLP